MSNEMLSELQKKPALFMLIVSIEFILFILIAYIWNPHRISDKYPAQITLFALILMFIHIIMYYFIRERSLLNKTTSTLPSISSFATKALSTVIAIICIVLLLIGVWWLLRRIDSSKTAVIWLINILIVSGALSICYLFYKQIKGIPVDFNYSINNITKKTFIFNLIFYIPCLLIKLSNYIKEEYKLTTKVVWIVLAVEFILIALRFILPMIWKKMISHDGVVLLNNPVYLNKQYTLGSFESLHENNVNKKSKFKYNYSLSAWFYINPQPPNTSSAYTKYSNILNYGQKPLLQYNGIKNSLRVQTEIEDRKLVTIYETNDIKYQKWNNIVVNCDDGNMDIFINGKIVATRKNVAPYMSYENVTTGEEHGIHGGICNVIYYNRVLSLSHINLVYKTLNEKNIPVI